MDYINLAKEALLLGHRGAKHLMSRRKQNGITRVDTEFLAKVTLVAGQASLNLSDVNILSQDILELGDIYRFYRFTRLVLEFPAPNWGTGTFLGVSYTPTAVGAYSGFDRIEAPRVALVSASQTVPTRLEISSKMLKGMTVWYLNNATATDPSLETQGAIVFQTAVTSAEDIIFKVRAECEFKELLDPATIAMNLARKKQQPENPTQSDESKTKGKQLVVGPLRAPQKVQLVRNVANAASGTKHAIPRDEPPHSPKSAPTEKSDCKACHLAATYDVECRVHGGKSGGNH